MINAFATEKQYLDKLLPIWWGLPDDLKGDFTLHPRLGGTVEMKEGFQLGNMPNQDGFLMVASHNDSKYAIKPFIYVEHGAGQSYGPDKFYSNSHRPNMLAAMVPGPYCAGKTRKANPYARVIQMGAPHLTGIPALEPQCVTFAWHWRCSVAVEANTAFDEYRDVVPLVAANWKTLGHGHPRIIGELLPFYQEHGIEISMDSRQTLARTGLLIADNTSLIYEAAVLNIPVILLNKSEWVQTRSHGLRFWEALPGPMVDTPAELLKVVDEQLAGGSEDWRSARRSVASLIYGIDPLGQLMFAVDELAELVRAES